VLTIVSLVLTLPSANAAQLIWAGDFEEGASSINGSKTADFAKKVEADGIEADADVRTGSGMDICTRPRAGSYAGRSRVLSGGAGEQVRAELKANAPGVIPFKWDGPEYWLAVSLCLADWPAGSDVNTLYQIHAPNEASGSRCDFAGNALTIGVENDTAFISIINNPDGISNGSGAFSNTRKVHSFNFRNTLGKWQDFVFKIKLSTKGTGYYTAWHNGNQVASGSGLVNVNWKDSCGNPIDKKYSNGPHVGFYGGPNNAGPKTIYIDSLKVAEGTSGFDLVSPGGAAATSAVPNAPSNLVVQ
jgi:hypothetical protein